VAAAMASAGCGADALGFAITEAVIMDKPERGMATLRGLRALGVHLTIDDFGMASSSLRHLKQMSIDALKIDRCFIAGVDSDAADAAVVHSIIHLAQDFRLQVIAEGVESEAQLDFLRAQGCDIVQGDYCQPALTAPQLAAFVAAALTA